MQPNPASTWTVVTGASAGIGKALVERLAKDGRDVVALARDPARVSVPNGPGRVEVVRLDLEDSSAVEPTSRDIAKIVGAAGLAGLVNMAGIIVEGPLEVVPPDAIRKQFEVNVIGPVSLTLGVAAAARQGAGNGGQHRRHFGSSDGALLWPHRRIESGPRVTQRRDAAGVRAAWDQSRADRTRRHEDGHLCDVESGARRMARATPRHRSALSACARRDGARLREVRRRQSRGRRHGGHGGAFGSPNKVTSRGWEGRGRFRVDVATPNPPARPAGEIGAWAERRAQARQLKRASRQARRRRLGCAERQTGLGDVTDAGDRISQGEP